MPTAICATCNQVTHWRNQRGARLADMRCMCGGCLKAAVWTEQGYQIRETRGAKKGGLDPNACAVVAHASCARRPRARSNWFCRTLALMRAIGRERSGPSRLKPETRFAPAAGLGSTCRLTVWESRLTTGYISRLKALELLTPA